MPNFTGFSSPHLATIRADFGAAQQLCMRCSNSLLLAAVPLMAPGGRRDYALRLRPEVVQLLQEAFSIDGSDDQQVGRIKDTFLTFGPRMANALVRFAPHQAAPNRWDFAAFVDPSRPTDLFIRPGYFGLQAVDRAATLIHEYIHMKYPNNSGDGHPGGQYISFTRASLNVPFDQAVRNPYCFQYYAQYVGTLGP